MCIYFWYATADNTSNVHLLAMNVLLKATHNSTMHKAICELVSTLKFRATQTNAMML